MITLEQYLSVALMQEQENPALYSNWHPDLSHQDAVEPIEQDD
jgi:hypothetical protein